MVADGVGIQDSANQKYIGNVVPPVLDVRVARLEKTFETRVVHRRICGVERDGIDFVGHIYSFPLVRGIRVERDEAFFGTPSSMNPSIVFAMAARVA